jgi:hypothetical protein
MGDDTYDEATLSTLTSVALGGHIGLHFYLVSGNSHIRVGTDECVSFPGITESNEGIDH